MITIPITFDLSGYSYDPNNPTQQAERVFFIIYQLLDSLKTQGAEIRQMETADITSAESAISDLYDLVTAAPAETMPALPTIDSDLLLDETLGNRLTAIRQESLITAWRRWLATQGSEGGITTTEEGLAKLAEIAALQLSKEDTLYLSDGTPIYVSSGLIG